MSDRVEKKDAEKGAEWVSEQERKGVDAALDKELKDTFPASDPPSISSGATGFVAEPDVTETIVEGPGKAAARNLREDLPRRG